MRKIFRLLSVAALLVAAGCRFAGVDSAGIDSSRVGVCSWSWRLPMKDVAAEMEKAAELLRRGEQSVSEIASAVGYDSPSRFSAAFRERYHMLPTEYRKQLK